MIKHEQIEKSVPLLIILTLLVVVWGGLLEIVPLFLEVDYDAGRRGQALRCG